MLTNYEIKGYKSINNPLKIDLASTNYKILSKTNVSNTGILKGAVFVGSNGSGKSNIISPIKLLLDLLFSKETIDFRNYFCFFSEHRHFVLTYEFLIRSSKVVYIIEVTYGNPINLNEKLFVDDELLVERIGSNGRYLSSVTPIRSSSVEDNQLFVKDLYVASILNSHKVLSEWIKYLSNSIFFNCIEQKFTTYLHTNPNKSMMQIYDKQVSDMNAFLKRHNFEMEVQIKHDNNRISLRIKKEHSSIALPIQMESNGIRCLLKLLPLYYHVIENGGILILDEFEVLHPSTMNALISEFNEVSKNAQILIATNNTNVLSANIFRADQIYAVDFENETSVNRFSNLQPRELQNMEKMYFKNIFGGLSKIK